MKKFFIAFSMIIFFANISFGGNIEVEADQSLEWHKQEKIYLAKGNAVIRREGVTVKADIIYAYYEESEDSDIEVWKIEANGNVLIEDGEAKLISNKAVYLVDKEEFSSVGTTNLLSDEYQVKSKSGIKYFRREKQMVANDDVMVFYGENTLNCNSLIVNFEEDSSGKLTISNMIALEDVVIESPTEKVNGQKAEYDVESQIVLVDGDVTIARENAVIVGDRTEVDMSNKEVFVTKMLSKSKNNRVKAVFISEEE